MARRASSGLSHEHWDGGGGILCEQNRSSHLHRHQQKWGRGQEVSCSLVESGEALQSGCQTVHLILI